LAKFKDLIRKSTSLFRFTPENPPEKFGGSYFYPLLSNSTTYNDLQLLKDYEEIPEISAIINLKAKAFSKMKLRIVSNKTGEEEQDAKNYEYKIKVLRNPNWFQSQKEFMMQTKIFREIWGNEYIYLNYPFGMPSRKATAMFTLPSNLVTTNTPSPLPFYLQTDPTIEYTFQWGNDKYIIPKENLIHLNDNRVHMTKENWVEGQSWLAYQRATVNNIREAYYSRGFIIKNIGVQGILTNAAGKDAAGQVPIDHKQVEDVQKRIAQMRGFKDKFPVIATNLPLAWQKMSVDNPANLGLYEEVKEDMFKLCDAAGTPSELFGSSTGSTFANQIWAERRLYENTIIPEAEEWIGALNSQFETENESWSIVGSFTHLNVFKENMKDQGDAINRMATGLSRALADNAISINEYRDELRRMGLVIGENNGRT
jgi:hypothetical protein